MARLPRLTLAGQVHLVLLRGNNRQALFFDAQDRQAFLQLLQAGCVQHQVALHGYALLESQVQLLLTPATSEGLPKMMQDVGRRYVRGFNARHLRTGTLWEGRYRATVVQADPYLLRAMVHIDLLAVRAGLVAQAADDLWSSHGHYVGLRSDGLLTPHAIYWGLGNTPYAREAAYRERVLAGLLQDQHDQLMQATLKGWVLGAPEFVAQLQNQTSRRLSPGERGRPRLVAQNPSD